MPPKSGHQRAKNVGYNDDDGFDDEYYEEEEGFTIANWEQA
jgi:elongation factor 1 alpha-like protein